jgi:hypothetical protein
MFIGRRWTETALFGNVWSEAGGGDVHNPLSLREGLENYHVYRQHERYCRKHIKRRQ